MKTTSHSRRVAALMRFHGLNKTDAEKRAKQLEAKAGVKKNPAAPKRKTRTVRKNPAVHFDIDVNSHNARGAKAKTRTNPLSLKMATSKKPANFPYCVEQKNTENWNTSACFKNKTEAFEYAKALSVKYPALAIRVMEYKGGAM